MRHLQQHGKGFFAINEWGAGPDYHLNPSKTPFNVSEEFGPQNRAIRQFVVAAFMMVNGGACGIYLTCIQCYGGGAGGLGGMSIWPEYAAPVGHPLSEPVRASDSGECWVALAEGGGTWPPTWLPRGGGMCEAVVRVSMRACGVFVESGESCESSDPLSRERRGKRAREVSIAARAVAPRLHLENRPVWNGG